MMHNNAILFLLFFTSFFCFQASSRRVQVGYRNNGIPMFMDHYFLAMQWQEGLSTEFTIHGLWPGDSWDLYNPPLNCKMADNLRHADIASLEADLDFYWPDLVNGRNHNFWFWNYEWLRHGTCSGLTQYQYFELAIRLANNLPLRSDLSVYGVIPGYAYLNYEFTDPIFNLRRSYPGIFCVNSELREFRVNYTNDYPNAVMQDVDPSRKHHYCNDNSYIYYPEDI